MGVQLWATANAVGSRYTRSPQRKVLVHVLQLGESNNSRRSRSEGLARSFWNFGRFAAIPTRPRPLSFLADYPVVQFMSANDCNLRSIRLVKHFPPSLFFDLDFRPSSSSAGSATPPSVSLGLYLVRFTRMQKSAKHPEETSDSWSDAVNVSLFVVENYSLPQLCTEDSRTFFPIISYCCFARG